MPKNLKLTLTLMVVITTFLMWYNPEKVNAAIDPEVPIFTTSVNCYADPNTPSTCLVNTSDSLIATRYWFIYASATSTSMDWGRGVGTETSKTWLAACGSQPHFTQSMAGSDVPTWTVTSPDPCSYFLLHDPAFSHWAVSGNVMDFDPITPLSLTNKMPMQFGGYSTSSSIGANTAPFKQIYILDSNFPIIVKCVSTGGTCTYNTAVAGVEYLWSDAVHGYDPPSSGYQYVFDGEGDSDSYLEGIIGTYTPQDCGESTNFLEEGFCNFSNFIGGFAYNVIKFFARIIIPDVDTMQQDMSDLGTSLQNQFDVHLDSLNILKSFTPSPIPDVQIDFPYAPDSTVIDFDYFNAQISTVRTITGIILGIGMILFSYSQFQYLLHKNDALK